MPAEHGQTENQPPSPSNPWALLDLLASFSWRLLVCAGAIALVSFVLIQLSFVVVPFFLAVLFSSILMPITDRLKDRRMSAGGAATATIGIVFLVILGVLMLTVPPLISNADDIVRSLDLSLDRLAKVLEDAPFNLSATDATQLTNKLEDIAPKLQEMLISGVGTLVPLIAQGIVMAVLAIVMTGYMLHDGDKNWRWMLGFVEEPRRPAINRLGTEAYETMAAYLRGTALVATFNTVAITFGAFLLGLPLLLPIAITVFVAAFLPIIGAWIAAGMTILIALASGGVETAIYMGLIYLLVSQFKSYFISPFVVGSRVKLAPIVTLTTVMIGTVLGGIVGGIVAVPLVATISGVLGQLRRWRVDGRYGSELIPILPPREPGEGPGDPALQGG